MNPLRWNNARLRHIGIAWIALLMSSMTGMVRVTTAAHPVHASLSEFRWDADRQCFECSLRLQFEDVRRLVHPAAGTRGHNDIETRLRVLADSFRLVTTEQDATNEDAAEQTAKPKFAAKTSTDTSSNAADEHQTNFANKQLVLASGERYRWIGSEDVKGYTWWHFEIHPSPKRATSAMNIRLFRHLDRDHRHRLTWVQTDPPVGFDLTENDPVVRLPDELFLKNRDQRSGGTVAE